MKAITVEPKKQGTARLEDVPEPDARDGSVLDATTQLPASFGASPAEVPSQWTVRGNVSLGPLGL